MNTAWVAFKSNVRHFPEFSSLFDTLSAVLRHVFGVKSCVLTPKLLSRYVLLRKMFAQRSSADSGTCQVTTQWEYYSWSTPVNGSLATENDSSVYSCFIHLAEPYEYGGEMDVPLWGNSTCSTSSDLPGSQNFSYQSGYSSSLRYDYVMQQSLQDIVDPNFRHTLTSS